MANERLLLVTTVPPDHLDALLAAMTTAGAGVLGAYSECAFICAGQGRFRAGELSNPAYGETRGAEHSRRGACGDVGGTGQGARGRGGPAHGAPVRGAGDLSRPAA